MCLSFALNRIKHVILLVLFHVICWLFIFLWYLRVSAEGGDSSVGPPPGQSLDSSVVVLRTRQSMSVSTQEELLLAGTLDLHHHILEYSIIWESEK